MAKRRVLVFGAAVIVLNVVTAAVAVWMNWPTQFGRVGTDAGADVLTSGTAISAPMAPLALLVVSLLLVRAGGRWTIAGLVGFCLVAVVFLIGGLGEAFAPATADVSKTVLVASGIGASAIVAPMLVLAVTAFTELRRG